MQTEPRYPIGKFDQSITVTMDMRREFINIIEDLPSQLRIEVENLSEQ